MTAPSRKPAPSRIGESESITLTKGHVDGQTRVSGIYRNSGFPKKLVKTGAPARRAWSIATSLFDESEN